MSTHISRREPKAWEGYLVLLALGPAPLGDGPVINDLRYDTNRVRKIVATGNDLSSVKDVEACLLPLLPLSPEVSRAAELGILERLPDVLARYGVSRRVAGVAIEAFMANESILDRLHELGSKK